MHLFKNVNQEMAKGLRSAHTSPFSISNYNKKKVFFKNEIFNPSK